MDQWVRCPSDIKSFSLDFGKAEVKTYQLFIHNTCDRLIDNSTYTINVEDQTTHDWISCGAIGASDAARMKWGKLNMRHPIRDEFILMSADVKQRSL